MMSNFISGKKKLAVIELENDVNKNYEKCDNCVIDSQEPTCSKYTNVLERQELENINVSAIATPHKNYMIVSKESFFSVDPSYAPRAYDTTNKVLPLTQPIVLNVEHGQQKPTKAHER